MPIKYPFTPRELINAANRNIMNRVAEIFETCPHRDGLILEDCGSWLVQSDWTDRTGYYMTIRLAPLDKGRKEVQEAGRDVTRKFLGLFPERKQTGVTYEGQEGYLDGEKVTVFVETDVYSIGD